MIDKEEIKIEIRKAGNKGLSADILVSFREYNLSIHFPYGPIGNKPITIERLRNLAAVAVNRAVRVTGPYSVELSDEYSIEGCVSHSDQINIVKIISQKAYDALLSDKRVAEEASKSKHIQFLTRFHDILGQRVISVLADEEDKIPATEQNSTILLDSITGFLTKREPNYFIGLEEDGICFYRGEILELCEPTRLYISSSRAESSPMRHVIFDKNIFEIKLNYSEKTFLEPRLNFIKEHFQRNYQYMSIASITMAVDFINTLFALYKEIMNESLPKRS